MREACAVTTSILGGLAPHPDQATAVLVVALKPRVYRCDAVTYAISAIFSGIQCWGSVDITLHFGDPAAWARVMKTPRKPHRIKYAIHRFTVISTNHFFSKKVKYCYVVCPGLL